jgi:hypothetical protein
MAYNLNVFDTYYMLGMMMEIVPVQTFFRDRYFPTDDSLDIFAADKVLIEYKEGDRRMAPFVVARAGDIPIARGGYEMDEIAPSSILPSRALTIDDLKKRGFGEAILANKTAEERAVALQTKDLKDLDARITRREEWMCAQTMINNGCTITEYLDSKTVGQTRDVYYYDTSGSNPALYTVGAEWDNAGDFMGDVGAMCESLEERGLPATDLVVGSDVGKFILSNETLQKLLDNRRMEYGTIAPKNLTPGVSWLGKLNFSGFELDVFSVRETYVDESGVTQRYFPAKSAMVTAPGCGRLMYAHIDQMEADEQIHTFTGKRIPKYVPLREADMRKLRLGSRPLAAPNQKAPWMYAPNVVL